MYEEEDIEPEFLNQAKTNPFRTPEGYFGSLEDRVMENIHYQARPATNVSKIYRFLKPALGLAASFTLVYLLVYYPINNFLLKDTAKTGISEPSGDDLLDNYSLNLAAVDENTLVNAIFTDETITTTAINPDELMAYLSTGLNDVEIYAELQN